MINQFTLWSINPEQPEQQWKQLAVTSAESIDEAIGRFNENNSLPRRYNEHALITIA